MEASGHTNQCSKQQPGVSHKILFNYSSEMPIYFISIKDLIINKMLSDRTKDKLDVEMLQRIQKL